MLVVARPSFMKVARHQMHHVAVSMLLLQLAHTIATAHPRRTPPQILHTPKDMSLVMGARAIITANLGVTTLVMEARAMITANLGVTTLVMEARAMITANLGVAAMDKVIAQAMAGTSA